MAWWNNENEERIITRGELLSHLNRLLMVIENRIKREMAYHVVMEDIERLESLLEMRKDVDWREEKYLISYNRIYSELERIKDEYNRWN